MKSLRFLFVVLFVIISTSMFAGTERYSSILRGYFIDNGLMDLSDQKSSLPESSKAYLYFGAKDVYEGGLILPYKANISVKVNYTDYSGATSSETLNLNANYTPAPVFNSVEKNNMEVEIRYGYKSMSIEVLSLSVENDNGGVFTTTNQRPKNLFLEAVVETQRFDDLSTETMIINHAPLNNGVAGSAGADITANDQFINLFWNHIEGAEYYDLEYTYVDNISIDPNADLNNIQVDDIDELLPSEIFYDENVYAHSHTRVNTNENNYSLPTIYGKGYLIYRVRPIALTNEGIEVIGNWSHESSNPLIKDLSHWSGHMAKIIGQKDSDKMYTYSGTFAESGLKKEVYSIYDGASKNRQTQTLLNSSNQVVIGEQFYDYFGRPNLSVMPAPLDETGLGYRENLNTLGSSILGAPLFDAAPSTDCTPAPFAFDISNGSSKYYSPNNTYSAFNDFIPDAEGFVYAQTVYTNDNTGRVSRQSAPGEAFLPGNRSIQTFYEDVSQEELNRIFGLNAGSSKFYSKETVVDANYQASVTYRNQAGNVVASCLSGEPQNLLSVNSNGMETSPISIDILNKTQPHLTNTAEDNNDFSNDEMSLVSSSSVSISTNGSTFSINYDFNGATGIRLECLAPGIYLYPTYRINVSIEDECGELIYSSEEQKIYSSGGSYNNFSEINHTTGPLDIGSYIVTKRVSLDPIQMANDLDTFLDNISDDCVFNYEDFIQQYSSAIDANTVFPCEVCGEVTVDCGSMLSEALDLPANSLSYYFDPVSCSFNWSDPNFYFVTTSSNVSAEFFDDSGNLLLEEFTSYIESEIIACSQMLECAGDAILDCYGVDQEPEYNEISVYEFMLKDVSPPYGQYASLTPDDPLSLCNETNIYSSQHPFNYRYPFKANTSTPEPLGYRNQDGSLAKYYIDQGGALASSPTILLDGQGEAYVNPMDVSPEVFSELIQNNPHWAKQLIAYHPEFPKFMFYQLLAQHSDDVQLGSLHTISSEEYSEVLYAEVEEIINTTAADIPENTFLNLFKTGSTLNDPLFSFDITSVEDENLALLYAGNSLFETQWNLLLDLIQEEEERLTTLLFSPVCIDGIADLTGISPPPTCYAEPNSTSYTTDYETLIYAAFSDENGDFDYPEGDIFEASIADYVYSVYQNGNWFGNNAPPPPNPTTSVSLSEAMCNVIIGTYHSEKELSKNRIAQFFAEHIYPYYPDYTTTGSVNALNYGITNYSNECIGYPTIISGSDYLNPCDDSYSYYLDKEMRLPEATSFVPVTGQSDDLFEQMNNNIASTTNTMIDNSGLNYFQFLLTQFLGDVLINGNTPSISTTQNQWTDPMTHDFNSWSPMLYQALTGIAMEDFNTTPFSLFEIISRRASSALMEFNLDGYAGNPLVHEFEIEIIQGPSGYTWDIFSQTIIANKWKFIDFIQITPIVPSSGASDYLVVAEVEMEGVVSQMILEIRPDFDDLTPVLCDVYNPDYLTPPCVSLNDPSFGSSAYCELTSLGDELFDFLNYMLANTNSSGQVLESDGVGVLSNILTDATYLAYLNETNLLSGLFQPLDGQDLDPTSLEVTFSTSLNLFNIVLNGNHTITFASPSGTFYQSNVFFQEVIAFQNGHYLIHFSDGNYVDFDFNELPPAINPTIAPISIRDCGTSTDQCSSAELDAVDGTLDFFKFLIVAQYYNEAWAADPDITIPDAIITIPSDFNNSGFTQGSVFGNIDKSLLQNFPISISTEILSYFPANAGLVCGQWYSTSTETEWPKMIPIYSVDLVYSGGKIDNVLGELVCEIQVYPNELYNGYGVLGTTESLFSSDVLSDFDNSSSTIDISAYNPDGTASNYSLNFYVLSDKLNALRWEISSCISLPSCSDCGPSYLSNIETCEEAYSDYQTLVTGERLPQYFFDDEDMSVEGALSAEEKFCQANLGFYFNTYITYLDANVWAGTCGSLPTVVGTSIPMELEEIITAHPLYLSIEQFASLNFQEYESEYLDYINTILIASNFEKLSGISSPPSACQIKLNTILAVMDETVSPSVYDISQYFINPSSWASSPYSAECISSYETYLEDFDNATEPELPLHIADFCSGFAPPQICFPYTPMLRDNLDGPSYFFDPCNDGSQAELLAENGSILYDYELSIIADGFESEYKELAWESIIEDFSYSKTFNNKHYTLYKYDQAGNLIQTIPPEGVILLNTAQANAVQAKRATKPLSDDPIYYPQNQSYTTDYQYNSLNQLVWQHTPDGGITNFYYDDLGRIRFSQNEKQFANNQFTYSYTCYDNLSRIIESGEVKLIAAVSQTQLNNPSYPANDNTGLVRTQIVKTTYDEPLYTSIPASIIGSTGVLTQENLRGRVSATSTYDNNLDRYSSASHYSYDEHGNVKWLVQEIVAIDNSGDGRFKYIGYDYDLVSGNVSQVSYQPGNKDQFYHRYSYDADNKITEVHTSNDNIIWQNDARYLYYDHGPLARTELGDNKVQGLDYFYTLQGWLKGVNGEDISQFDIGKDGEISGENPYGSHDAFGFTLDYYDDGVLKDYIPSGSVNYTNGNSPASSLYNGNISQMTTSLAKVVGATNYSDKSDYLVDVLQNEYVYDQLNRIHSMQVDNLTASANTNMYRTAYTYDANGNIGELERYDDSGVKFDDFTYSYGSNNNQLLSVNEAGGPSNGTANDISSNQSYSYDEIGNLITDNTENLSISWRVDGKVADVMVMGTVSSGVYRGSIFHYDAMGNRISKENQTGNYKFEDKTYYIRDAQGNVMATYYTTPTSTVLLNHELYGSSRLGSRNYDSDYYVLNGSNTVSSTQSKLEYGYKRYELSNHLGNVLEIINDKKLANSISGGEVFFQPLTLSYSDYYPFGMLMPGRSENSSQYRYGFGGHEKDDELKGQSNHLSFGDYGFDPRIARRWRPDPLQSELPTWSPYAYALGNPIMFVDEDGNYPGISFMFLEIDAGFGFVYGVNYIKQIGVARDEVGKTHFKILSPKLVDPDNNGSMLLMGGVGVSGNLKWSFKRETFKRYAKDEGWAFGIDAQYGLGGQILFGDNEITLGFGVGLAAKIQASVVNIIIESISLTDDEADEVNEQANGAKVWSVEFDPISEANDDGLFEGFVTIGSGENKKTTTQKVYSTDKIMWMSEDYSNQADVAEEETDENW